MTFNITKGGVAVKSGKLVSYFLRDNDLQLLLSEAEPISQLKKGMLYDILLNDGTKQTHYQGIFNYMQFSKATSAQSGDLVVTDNVIFFSILSEDSLR